MGKHAIDATARSKAPREVVWRLLADGRGWSTWGPWTEAELEQEGSPSPDGVGAIKRLTRKPVTVREEVTLFEPPSRLVYRLLSGLPVRDYEGQVELSDTDDGTQIHWRSEFDAAPVIGTLLRWQLGRTMTDVAIRLAREAEDRTAARP